MKQKLTKRVVDGAHPGVSDRRVFDSEIPGFHLRIKPTGVKSYGLKYRIAGRQRNITIGRHGVLTPDQARVSARELLVSIGNGEDPSAKRKEKLDTPTFVQFWNLYLERHAVPRKSPKSVKEDERVWRLYIVAAFGNLKLTAINRLDIATLHSSMAGKPVAANRMLSLLSKMMNLAIDWGLRRDNPCKGIRKFKEHPRNRYLSTEERTQLAKALSTELDQAGAIAIWLCILTGARKGEVLQARWDQFDLESKKPVWQLPPETTKQRHVNRKPLSARTILLLKDWRDICPSSQAGWVVPGRNPEQQRFDLNGPWSRIRKSAKLKDVRLHDLRHDFASAAVAEGWSLEIIGRYLGHSSVQTTQRYAHLQDDPLLAMAEQVGSAYGE